ncbi:MAG: carbohydrate deacetylase [Beijerinckiaceae bacterium]
MTQGPNLIINADGYGFTPGVNEGILRTFEAGIVTSTSCTPNFGHLDKASEVQTLFPNVSFGIHFNLNVGPPCAPIGKVPSLVGKDGNFHGPRLVKMLLRRQVRVEEIEIELAAQAAMLADQGVKISHWDGHQNKHLWPVYFEAATRVAKKFNIPGVRSHRRQLYMKDGPATTSALLSYYLRNLKRNVTHLGGRLRTRQAEFKGFVAADRLITPGYMDSSHKSLGTFWHTLADTLAVGYTEVYCHPGFPDDLLRANSQYVDARLDEVRVLTAPDLLEHFKERRINLINFWDLHKARRR